MDQMLFETQLEELLREPLASVMRREQSAFDEATAPFSKSLVLMGAGGLGRKTLKGLRLLGIEPLAFADNNPTLWETEIEGVSVLSPQAAARKFGQRAAFVVTIWKGEATDRMADRVRQLIDLNCSKVVTFGPLFWKFPEIFLPHYSFDLPHKVYPWGEDALKVLTLWADSASRREYLAQLRWRMLLDFDGLPSPVTHEIYFPDDLIAAMPEDVFVDCGAYDGDTLRSFLQRQGTSFSQAFAFEPDPANFQKLQQYISILPHHIRHKITCYQYALGDCRKRVRFDATGTEASAVGSGAVEMDCIALDDLLGNCHPTYIKMDIEGSELDALVGARRIIERNVPVLAICVYHCQDHLWRIPLFINSLSDQYRFFLRPHLLEVWDLVCYAVPMYRLKSLSYEG